MEYLNNCTLSKIHEVMARSYTKEQSTYHAEREKKEAKKPKPINKVSEKKKAELEGRKIWTADQFKAAAKEVKKEKKLQYEKPKSTPVSVIKHDLDVIYSLVVRMQPAGNNGILFCVTCGLSAEWSKHQNGHYIKRSIAPSIIFDRMNTHPQCVRCNVLLEGNRLPYSRYMNNRYGTTAVELLELHSKKKGSKGAFEYQIMLQEYIELFLIECKRLNHTPTKIQQKIIDKWQK